MIPSYIDVELKSYFQVSSEDRKVLMDTDIFNFDPMSCDSRYLPLLAMELGVSNRSLTEAEYRGLISAAMRSQTKAGTAMVIKEITESVGFDVAVVELQSSPYIFDLDLSSAGREITPALMQNATRYANEYKNVRSHLGELRLSYVTEGGVSICAGAVGEVCATTQMLDGYTAVLPASVAMASGCVGEVSYTIRSQT